MAHSRLNLSEPNHLNEVLGSLKSYYVEENYVDLTFICRGNVFVPAHKLVLSSVSEFLKDLILSNKDELIYVSVPDVSPEKMKLLLNFLYAGGVNVTDDELANVREIITLLDLNLPTAVVLSGAAAEKLQKNLTRNIKSGIEKDPLNVPDHFSETDTAAQDDELSSNRISAPPNSKLAIRSFPPRTCSSEVKVEPLDMIEDDDDDVIFIEDDDEEQEDVNYIECPAAAVEVTYSAPQESSQQLKRKEPAVQVETTETKEEPAPKKVKVDTAAEKEKPIPQAEIDSISEGQNFQPLRKKRLSVPPARYADVSLPSTRTRRSDPGKNLVDSKNVKVEATTADETDDKTNNQKSSRYSWKIQLSPGKPSFNDSRSNSSDSPKNESLEGNSVSVTNVMSLKNSSNDSPATRVAAPTSSNKLQGTPAPRKTESPISGKRTSTPLVKKLGDASISKYMSGSLELNELDDSSRTYESEISDSSNLEEFHIKSEVEQDDDDEDFDNDDDEDDEDDEEMDEDDEAEEPEYFEADEQEDEIKEENLESEEKDKDSDPDGPAYFTWNNGRPIRDLTEKQINRLEQEYMLCRFPNDSKMKQLAYGLGLTLAKVKVWFVNRRLKEDYTLKREKIDLSEQHRALLEQEYQNDQVFTPERQKQIAKDLDIPHTNVQTWYYNRRKRPLVKRIHTLQFTEDQKDFLEKKFLANPCLLKEDIKNLSVQMGVSVYRLGAWFQEQRKLRGVKWVGRKLLLPLTDAQKSALQAEFQANPFPGLLRRQELASEIGISVNRLKMWFIQEQTANGLKRKLGREKLEFSEEQLNILETEYHHNAYPPVKVQEQLGAALDVNTYRITRWFVKRREEDGLSKKEKFQFTEEQLNILRNQYSTNPFPDVETQKQLAIELGVLMWRITKWFVDRREVDGLNKKEKFQFSDEQKEVLENEYQYNQYPDTTKQNEIAAQLDVPSHRVQRWFLDKREADGLSKKEKFQFTEEQLNILEKSYALNQFPSQRSQKQLAQKLGVLRYRVTRFFVDKREADGLTKYKKFQFNEKQLYALEREYEVNQFPGKQRQKELSEEFDINIYRVQSWFINKREENGLGTRKTVTLTKEQEEVLEREYQVNQYPDIQRVDQLAAELGLYSYRITRWFLKKRQEDGLKCEKTRPKVQFSEDQESLLEKEYEVNNNPDIEKQKLMAAELRVPVFYITRWYLNKRQADGLNAESSGSSPSFQFSSEEVALLKNEYNTNKYPDAKRQEELASELGVATYRVSNWFLMKRRLEGDHPRKVQFTEEQISFLEKEYESNNSPGLERQEEIAAELNIPQYRVQTWFLNKRREQGIRYSYPECSRQFTDEEKSVLEREYKTNQYPEQEKLEQIASDLGLSVVRITRWFWNRRQKHGLNYKDESKRKIQLTPEHWKILDEEFELDQFPGAEKLKQLGQSFGVPVSRITQWFQNKRNENHLKNSKKKILPLTFEQQDRLEEEYSKDRHPNLTKQRELAAELKVPLSRISVWFMRHRKADENSSNSFEGLPAESFVTCFLEASTSSDW